MNPLASWSLLIALTVGLVAIPLALWWWKDEP